MNSKRLFISIFLMPNLKWFCLAKYCCNKTDIIFLHLFYENQSESISPRRITENWIRKINHKKSKQLCYPKITLTIINKCKTTEVFSELITCFYCLGKKGCLPHYRLPKKWRLPTHLLRANHSSLKLSEMFFW